MSRAMQEAPSANGSVAVDAASSSVARKKPRVWNPLDAERPLRPPSKVCQLSVHRTHELFAANEGLRAPPFAPALEVYLRLKINDEYDFRNRFPLLKDPVATQHEAEAQLKLRNGADGSSKAEAIADAPTASEATSSSSSSSSCSSSSSSAPSGSSHSSSSSSAEVSKLSTADAGASSSSSSSSSVPIADSATSSSSAGFSGLSLTEMITALSPAAAACAAASFTSESGASALEAATSAVQTDHRPDVRGASGGGELASLQLRQVLEPLKPKWHPPWKLMRVISGHLGWVTCVDVDPTNAFFATGSNDRLIKIWDLASGTLKLSLTGHVSSLRDLKLSTRHPYLFSCAEDGRVKCWDLEQNRVVRDYHGHLSGVYTLALHPDLDLLCSGGRDAVVRVWDLRTKQQVYALAGHSGTVMSLQMQTAMPHIVSGSQDKMVRLWDLAAGKCQAVLTNHKKSVRAISLHPTEYSFVSCGADRLKVWRCPLGVFERNIDGHNAIPNCCTIRSEHDRSSLIVGTNNGQLHCWDWASGYKFQTLQSRVQPGSLESENGIFCCCLDKSETRLITGECDKTVKVWKIDEEATEETHPIDWKYTRSFKRF